MDKLFSVDQLAKRGLTTSRAVRLYVTKGLLKPMRIGRTLCFPEEAIGTLKRILRAKRLGFRLDEIGARKGGRDDTVTKDAIRRVEELISDAEEEISDLHQRLAHTSKRR